MRFRTAIPMVWRTRVFVPARTTLKRNAISTFLFFCIRVKTKLPFSANVSHSFLAMHVFDAFDGVRFFGREPCARIYTRFPNEF